MDRTVSTETLDELAHDDPAATRSRRDLLLINRVMRSAPILLGALRRALGDGASSAGRPVDGAPFRRPVADAAARPLRLLELGCGDGRLLLDVARTAGPAWRATTLTLLDRQPIVEPSTIPAYAALGWRAETRTADVLSWAHGADAGSGGAERWDAVVANLFLHHFDGESLTRVLAGCAARADALAACEPRRSAFALGASRLVGVLGANAVTREDAVLSVRAGFAAGELSAAWPAPAADWRLEEYDAGLFSHCFCASRRAGRDA